MLNKKVAKRIKEYRLKREITQEKLAKLIGMSQAEISRIENSATVITMNDIEKIANVLKVQTIDLIENSKVIWLNSERI